GDTASRCRPEQLMFEAILNERQTRVDRLQLFALLGLMLLGTAFVYSATMVTESAKTAALYNQIWFRQVIWYGMGAGAAAGLCLLDYRVLARWSALLYGISILLLLAVLIPGIGSTKGWGAYRWIDLGFFQFQPSELAKLTFILGLAHFLSRPVEELRLARNF